jgi:gliding motility-associated-like protein
MHKNILLLVLFITFCIPSFGGDSNCTNLGFELGNFTNWVGQTWLYSTEVPSINTSKSTGIVSRRQTIISNTSAYDANTGSALKEVPSGYSYSAKLGDVTKTTDSNPRCWEQSLRYTMTVDSSNALLIMKFACVLEYASDHTALMEPRFKVTLYDSTGTKISDCANYDVYSSSGTVKGFQTYTPSGSSNPVKWRDWTTVGANLLPYLGQTITIEFMSADCTGRFHFGYAYFVAGCQSMSITVKYCSSDIVATLTAPEGFESYSWTNSSGTVVGSAQTLQLTSPAEGAVYTCSMTSATGCTVSLQATVVKYTPKAGFSYALDCNTGTVQFTNTSTTNHGTLGYEWDFGDGSSSSEKNPTHTYTTSGKTYTVKLKITDSPSSCTDSTTTTVESFAKTLVGISGDSVYCPNDSITLKAYGAASYKWSTGSTADSITVSTAGKYWLIGYSTNGCISDTIYKTISQAPGWSLTSGGDSTFCQGLSSVLSVSGASSYLWNTGATTNTITVTTSGTYTVTGTSIYGCPLSKTFHITVYPLPNADFTLSTTTINTKHHEVTGSIAAESNVDYLWDLGDSTTATGTNFSHTYAISNSVLAYIVSLTATNQYGCSTVTTQTIDMVPFIPNVFSPNNDGVNDLFMPDLNLQIFDRNGLLLYKGSSGWDGTYNGKKVNPDTYFYLIKYTNSKNEVQTKKGYITLVK